MAHLKESNLKKMAWFLPLLLVPMMAADKDFDGVDDSVDLCPNSSFETIVDSSGCKAKNGLNITLGGSFALGDFGTTETYTTKTMDLFIGYKMSQTWLLSVGTSFVQSGTLNTQTVDLNETSPGLSDTYIYLGHVTPLSNTQSVLLQGVVKAPTGNSDLSTGEADYGVNLNYTFVKNKMSMYVQGGYMVITDSATQAYENIVSFSTGVGTYKKAWFHMLAFSYATPYIKGDESSMTVGYSTTYTLSRVTELNMGYSYGLTNVVSDHAFSASYSYAF